jgi:hypothetical protein
LQRENSDLASDDLKKMTPPLLERADAVLANDDVTTEELEAMSNELSACSCQWYDCVYEKEKADREREEAEKAAQQQGPQGPQPGTENM